MQTVTSAAEKRVLTEDLYEAWSFLSVDEKVELFLEMDRPDAEDFFLALEAHDQAAILVNLPAQDRRSWIRLLAPDDAADILQEVPHEMQPELLDLLDLTTRHEVIALLAYAEDEAGGLMDPRFMRVRPDMTADEAIGYLRKQAREHQGAIPYVYVNDEHQNLLGVVYYHKLFSSAPEVIIRDIMDRDLVTVPEDCDQEEVARLFQKHRLLAIPVVDKQNHVKGVVTYDDIMDVLRQENTEDIQKIGAVGALDASYIRTGYVEMIRKRAGWLTVLFLGELMTASAMVYFQEEIAQALVLTIFIPLIISSGGNAGSQASTLVIRAMALGEIKLRDWLRVFFREAGSGLTLGLILGSAGFLRVVLWPHRQITYGDHFIKIGFTVAMSLVGVVAWGTVVGASLPFVFRRLGVDPATASAPFVATLVDVTGLIIYFSAASLLLKGVLL